MAALSEPVVFADDIKDPNILFLDCNVSDDEITITQTSNLINVFKVENQKAIQSWSTKHGQHITSPAVWSSYNEKYITVLNKKIIKLWKPDEQNFEKAESKQAKCKIHKILCVDKTEPVVLFENGVVSFLSKMKTVSEDVSTNKDRIVYCDLVKMHSDLCLVVLSLQEDKQLHLSSHWLRNEEWIEKRDHIQLAPDTEYVCCHSELCGNQLKVFILCLNGDLLCQTVLFNHSTTTVLQTIPGVKKDTKIAILSSTHMVIVGCIKDSQEVIGLYDFKFGAFEVCKVLPSEGKSSLKVFVHHGRLYVLCHRTLYMYSYSCSQSTLSGILGHQRNESSFETVPDSISWSRSGKSPKTKSTDTRLFEELKNISLANSKKDIEKKFLKIFGEHIEHDVGLVCESSVMEQIIHRCVTDDKFWSPSIISQLLQHRMVPNRCVPMIVDGIIIHEDLDLLLKYMELDYDTPEESLCKIINFILSSENKKVTEMIESESQGHQCEEHEEQPLSAGKAFLVNRILDRPYNDVFMIECLHRVGFKHVLTLLEYLCYLITRGGSSEEKRGPDTQQVVNFICVLLDAHYQQLVISPDARVPLVNLHTTIQSQKEYYDEFLALDILLMQMKTKFAIPKQRPVGKYCIEVLHVL